MKLSLTQLFTLFMLLAFSSMSAGMFMGGAHAKTRVQILIYGDSLAAGYGLQPTDGFAPQLQRALAARRIEADIFNASQSGETTAGGLARLKWSLDGTQPDIIILELGANDALRAVAPQKTRANLEKMLTQLKARRIKILLAGMRAPPNLGPIYGKKFDAIYPELAKKHKAALYPFFLEGVAGQRKLNLRDGMHPNTQGIRRIVKGILPYIENIISERENKKGK